MSEDNKVDWKNGDECVFNGIDAVFIGYSKSRSSICAIEYIKEHCSIIDTVFIESLSKPLTPEQKQAQIDEKNGELFYLMASKTDAAIKSGFYHLWSNEEQETKSHYIELAKQINFPGKLID